MSDLDVSKIGSRSVKFPDGTTKVFKGTSADEIDSQAQAYWQKRHPAPKAPAPQPAVIPTKANAPITPTPLFELQRKQVADFHAKYLEPIFNPSIPNQAAKALALNPDDKEWNARLKKMNPISQAAILEHADAIRENMQRGDRESRDRAGDTPFGGATAGQAHGFLQNAIRGYEGANALQSEKGFGASAQRFVTGLLDPESLAMLYGAEGAVKAGGPLAARAITGLFAGSQAKSAYDKLRSDDPGGAFFDLTLAGLAIGAPKIADKIAEKRAKAAAAEAKVATESKTETKGPGVLAKAAGDDPLLKKAAEPKPAEAKIPKVKTKKSGIVPEEAKAVSEGVPAKQSKVKKSKANFTPLPPEQQAEIVKKNTEAAAGEQGTKGETDNGFTSSSVEGLSGGNLAHNRSMEPGHDTGGRVDGLPVSEARGNYLSNAYNPQSQGYAHEWIATAAKNNGITRKYRLNVTFYDPDSVAVGPSDRRVGIFLGEALGRPVEPYREGWKVTETEAKWLGFDPRSSSVVERSPLISDLINKTKKGFPLNNDAPNQTPQNVSRETIPVKPGRFSVFDELEKQDAVPEQKPDESMLRQSGPELGLSRLEPGDTQPQEVTRARGEEVSQNVDEGRSRSDAQEGLTPKDVQVAEKGPQELETFNPLRAVLGSDRYDEVNDKIAKLYLGAKATVSPGGVSPEAKTTALSGRDYLGQMAHESVQRDHDFSKVRNAFDRIEAKAPGKALRFMFDTEAGNAHVDPAAQAYSDAFRKALDDKLAEVTALGKAHLKQAIANYFPHIWKDPNRASQFLGAYKRPLEGNKAFLHKRKIPTIEQGMFPQGTPANLDTMSMNEIKAEVQRQGGLEPVSYNPAELVQMKLQEQDKYIFAQKWFGDLKDQGITKMVRKGRKPPSGYVKINDSIAKVGSRGEWYAPEGAARIINNYLSPGLAGHETMGPAFRAIRSAGNMLVQAKLGLSGFHATGESINAMVSGNAKAFQELSRGKVKEAVKSAVVANTGVGTPIKYYAEGQKLYAEYLKPGSQSADYAKLVDYLIKGGGRVELPQEFRIGAMEGLAKALRRNDIRGQALNLIPAAVEGTMAPLMRNMVPRLKLGAFADMMSDEIDRLGPNATLGEQREAASRIWDSVEDRFGELTYDNLFWDNTFKDIVHLFVMAPGWNLGSARTLAGGVTDVLTTRSRVQAGGRVLSERTAFGLSLAASTAVLGYVYNKLHGNDPKTLEDLFFPVGPAGKRVQLPTYVRDVHGVATDPITTVGNKMHPLVSMVGETLSGRDHYGRPIRKDGGQYMRYLGKQILPISLRGSKNDSIRETIKKMFTTPEGRERAMGITPVPKGSN